MDQQLAGFYETLAQVAFTVLGLWLVAAQLMEGRGRPMSDWRLGHAVSLQLAVLGAMSLLAQVDIEDGVVWRVTFAVGGALSALLVYGRAVRGRTDPLTVTGVSSWLLVAIDVAVALMAFVSNRALDDAGSSLTALEIEAILLSALILVAINVGVWLVFEPRPAE